MKQLLQNSKYFSEDIFADNKCPAKPEEWPGEAGYRIFRSPEWQEDYFGRGTIQIETLLPVITHIAIKIYITGREPIKRSGGYRIRAQFEFLQDGEPSIFSPGWMWVNPDWRF